MVTPCCFMGSDGGGSVNDKGRRKKSSRKNSGWLLSSSCVSLWTVLAIAASSGGGWMMSTTSTTKIPIMVATALVVPHRRSITTRPTSNSKARRPETESTALSTTMRMALPSSTRKRNRVRRWGSTVSSSLSRSKLVKLGSKKNDNDIDDDSSKNNEENVKKESFKDSFKSSFSFTSSSDVENSSGQSSSSSSSLSPLKDLTKKMATMKEQVLQMKVPVVFFKKEGDEVSSSTAKTTTTVGAILEAISSWLLSIRKAVAIGTISFVAGTIFTLGAIFVPVYSSVEKLTEPVTLFETILSDLEQGYVDEVDTQKLFETGISAMLSSLDPYTEYEGKQQAETLNESIEGKYGGVGLVISGRTTDTIQEVQQKLQQKNKKQTVPSAITKPADVDLIQSEFGSYDTDIVDDDLDDEDDFDVLKLANRVKDRGIHVVSAFEGYAFDYGMRVGDKLVAIDDFVINDETSVEDVRNNLRGVPGTEVTISFEREGVKGVQSVTMPRSVVKLRNVKLATMLGTPQQHKEGNTIGYIQLSGFAADAGKEVRNAILSLQAAALDATDGQKPLQGLILDLRGNPGGLLTSAVDVSSLLVPKGSDIVSAKGRGFPGVLYRSRVDPILDPSTTKLAVLVNGGTASAAEIVSGAVQDLDVGIIVGQDRTFGKGLVQNVETLPFDTALKFTIAKYYTPSGRCIQGINYSEGGGLDTKGNGPTYVENVVPEDERSIFYTRSGRIVRDGGGIEADLKVALPKASALEITLLRTGLLSDFAEQWSRNHQLTNNFQVDDATYKELKEFIAEKQTSGDVKLEALYSKPINDLKKALKQSGYKSSKEELTKLRETILREVMNDFEKYKSDIKEDLSQAILARYYPESMLIERNIKTDKQVNAAMRLLSNPNKFDKLLAAGSTSSSSSSSMSTEQLAQREDNPSVASSATPTDKNVVQQQSQEQEGASFNVQW